MPPLRTSLVYRFGLAWHRGLTSVFEHLTWVLAGVLEGYGTFRKCSHVGGSMLPEAVFEGKQLLLTC